MRPPFATEKKSVSEWIPRSGPHAAEPPYVKLPLNLKKTTLFAVPLELVLRHVG